MHKRNGAFLWSEAPQILATIPTRHHFLRWKKREPIVTAEYWNYVSQPLWTRHPPTSRAHFSFLFSLHISFLLPLRISFITSLFASHLLSPFTPPFTHFLHFHNPLTFHKMAHASLVDDSLEATADPHLTDAELRIVKESIKVVVENYNSEGRIPRAPGTTRKNLKNRLLLTMGRMKEYKVPATRWRKDKGRKVYLQVLKACPHLFLAFVAAVAPTVCHRLKDDNIQTLIQDNEVEPLRLRLNADAKDFLNSVATEGKFANDQRYLGLVSSLFPEVERLDCEGAGLLKSSAIRHDTGMMFGE
ncbi:hypothetical protein ACLOAV_010379 [Pseudogymnoascus australis]